MDGQTNTLEKASSTDLNLLSTFINKLPESQIIVEVTNQDFEKAMASLQPSVTIEELQDYVKLGMAFDDTLKLGAAIS